MGVLVLQALIVILPVALLRWLRPTDGREPVADFHQFPIMLRALGGLRQYPALFLVSVLLHLALGATALIPLMLGWGPPTSIENWRLGVWLLAFVPTLLPPLIAAGALTPLRRERVSTTDLLRGAGAALRGASLAPIVVATLVAAPVGCVLALTDGLRTTAAAGGVAAFALVCAVVASMQLFSALCLAPILSVDRRVSLRAALRGALDLSHGYRARLLGVNMLFLWLAGALLAWFADRWADPRVSDLLFVLLMGALLWATHAVTLVIIYHRLRVLKHGDEATRIADIFK